MSFSSQSLPWPISWHESLLLCIPLALHFWLYCNIIPSTCCGHLVGTSNATCPRSNTSHVALTPKVIFPSCPWYFSSYSSPPSSLRKTFHCLCNSNIQSSIMPCGFRSFSGSRIPSLFLFTEPRSDVAPQCVWPGVFQQHPKYSPPALSFSCSVPPSHCKVIFWKHKAAHVSALFPTKPNVTSSTGHVGAWTSGPAFLVNCLLPFFSPP